MSRRAQPRIWDTDWLILSKLARLLVPGGNLRAVAKVMLTLAQTRSDNACIYFMQACKVIG